MIAPFNFIFRNISGQLIYSFSATEQITLQQKQRHLFYSERKGLCLADSEWELFCFFVENAQAKILYAVGLMRICKKELTQFVDSIGHGYWSPLHVYLFYDLIIFSNTSKRQ